MVETPNSISVGDLPHHLILEVLITGRISPVDLVNIELTSKVFGWGTYSSDFKSIADYAAYLLCVTHPIYMGLHVNKQKSLVTKCKGNWKRVLRFLVSTEKYSKDNTRGRDIRTIRVNNIKVYSCGPSMFGDLAQWSEAKRCCVELKRKEDLSFYGKLVQVSVSENNSAFVMHSGEVFTCGKNYLFGCGHLETGLPISSPKLVEALETIPCKQVATGLYSTVFLTREGHVYTVGGNARGQLGHGDTVNIQELEIVEVLKNVGPVVQIVAGPQFVLALTNDGMVYSFGDGYDLCLGHGDSMDKLKPHVIEYFKSKSVHVLRVCAGDFHVVALDSNGDVYTWGRGSQGALGHGYRRDKPIPQVLLSLKNHLAVQIRAKKDDTLVEVEGDVVYGFGSEFGIVPKNNRLPPWTRNGRLLSAWRSSRLY